jgi:hypothetical protein
LRTYRLSAKAWFKFISLLSVSGVSADYDFDTSVVRVTITRGNLDSACGMKMLCVRRRGGIEEEHTCTIGGIIRIDDTVWGLTTAHSLVPFEEDATLEAGVNYDSETDRSSFSISPRSSATSVDPPNEHVEHATASDTHKPSSSEPAPYWMSSRLGPYSYGMEKNPMTTNTAYAVSEGSDFALIEMAGFPDLRNVCRGLYPLSQLIQSRRLQYLPGMF